jgi:hypothetical protein
LVEVANRLYLIGPDLEELEHPGTPGLPAVQT